MVFPQGEAVVNVDAAYGFDVTGTEMTEEVPKGWSVFQVATPEDVTASLFITTVEAAVAETDLGLHVVQGFATRLGQHGADARQNAVAGAIVVDPGRTELLLSVNVAKQANVTLRSQWGNFTSWSPTGMLRISVLPNWWSVVRVEGLAAGKVYDIKILGQGNVEIGSAPTFLSVLKGKAVTTSDPAWLTVENPTNGLLVDAILNATVLPVEVWNWTERTKSVFLPAGAVFLATMMGGEDVSMLRVGYDMSYDKVKMMYRIGTDWTEPTMEMGTEVRGDTVALKSVRYNIRIFNGAATHKTVMVNFLFTETGEGNSDEGELTGMDVLAMFICVVFVFIIFTILATFTMHRMDAAGKLVVSDESLDS